MRLDTLENDMKKVARVFMIVYLVQAVVGATVGTYIAVAYTDQMKVVLGQVTTKIERALDVTH